MPSLGDRFIRHSDLWNLGLVPTIIVVGQDFMAFIYLVSTLPILASYGTSQTVFILPSSFLAVGLFVTLILDSNKT